ncbi:MAG: response regulator [Candidatus Latescibacteria bacterium]|nr:response regulator [Candidatus Latescibacterota bacterium]
MKINRVLVIESDDALREAVLSAFSVAVQAFGASTGKEALQLLEELSPTIVLLNLQLQDMDGFTVLECVRERLSGARVIVTSDSGNYDLVCRVTEVGVGDFLEKPYSTEDLFNSFENSVRKVDQHLDYWTLATRYNQKSRLRRRAMLACA